MLNSKSDDEGKKNYLICIILRNGIAFMSNRVILKNFYMHRYFNDSFYDYVMEGKKGSKRPRGDKEQMMRYSIPKLSLAEEA